MAKALLGHVGLGSDLRLTEEVRRLRERVRQLEIETARLRAENDELVATLAVEREMLVLEPALTLARRCRAF